MELLEGLDKLKELIDFIGTRNRDLLACSMVPQPTTLPRIPPPPPELKMTKLLKKVFLAGHKLEKYALRMSMS
jgi:hypothetical protein